MQGLAGLKGKSYQKYIQGGLALPPGKEQI